MQQPRYFTQVLSLVPPAATLPISPLRADMLSDTELGSYAEDLARRSSIAAHARHDQRALRRFKQNGQALESIYFTLARAAESQPVLPPGSDWYLDNFHVIENHIREIRRSLPRGYERRLPILSEGSYGGLPRVYAIAREFLIHRDSVVDRAFITAFIAGYQKVQPLGVGELWAIPIFLRMILVDHLRQLGDVCLARLESSETAEAIIGDIVGAEQKGTDIVLSLASRLNAPEIDFEDLAVPVLRKLRTFGLRTAAAVHWLEERLKERGVDIAEVNRREQAARAADQITIGNCISSLRSIDTLNWRSWIEDLSPIDRVLNSDPAAAYAACDFETRDIIRHHVENLSRETGREEYKIAERILELARAAAASEFTDPALKLRRSHVGYYLLAEGLEELERDLGLHETLDRKLSRFTRQHRVILFLGTLLAIAASLALYPVEALTMLQAPLWLTAITTLLFLVLTSEIGLQVIQWFSAHAVRPRHLPKLDLSDGLPSNLSSIVAVQGIFRDKDTITKFIEALEVRYLANNDTNIKYVLLGDLFDAAQEVAASDAELIEHAKTLIEHLNNQTEHKPFFLFFRRRIFSKAEGRFMGWERKRGKIHEFNQFLLGKEDSTLLLLVGEAARLRGTRFVITLDADTALPRGAAQKLIGAMAHPLNTAIFNDRGIISQGYAIIQPRVTTSLTSAHSSWFSWLFTGQTGLDPYTSLISNFYQDLFGRASYVGKGIYDVVSFERALADRIPENALLSHDLFESCFARTGLASDIEVLDDFPSRFNSFARREHRWVRGDWQLTPWLLPTVPSAKDRLPNPLPTISRWKIIDNLRRSLIAPAAFTLLVGSFSFLPGSSLYWSSMVLAVLLLPIVFGLANSVITPPRNASVSRYSRNVLHDSARHLMKAGVSLVMLPYQAYLMLHAILVTLWRVFVSKRHLLEWETAYYSERRSSSSALSVLRETIGGLFLTTVAANGIALYYPTRMGGFIPLLLLWLVSPFVAQFLDRRFQQEKFNPADGDIDYLRSIAFQTWTYFDDHVSAENNYLIPDNIQLAPNVQLALRTSPTNIGLALLATIAGHDFGFATLPSVLARLKSIVDTLGRMERWEGHLYNWYDIRSLAPLAPRYVSSVDSGNFVANMMLVASYLAHTEDMQLWSVAQSKHLQEMLTVLSKSEIPTRASIAREMLAFVRSAPLRVRSLDSVLERLSGLVVDNQSLSLPQQYAATKEERALSYVGHVIGLRRFLRWTSLLPVRISDAALASFCARQEFSLLDLSNLRSSVHDTANALAKPEAEKLCALFEESCHEAHALRELARTGKDAVTDFLRKVNFKPLYDDARDAFTIGMNLDIARRDTNHYDLLASEARLTSFIAVARGEVPQRHWFKLGRGLTDTPGGRALLSWSGTMFEYLMPILVLRDYPGTLLANTHRAVVRAQEHYAAQRGVPWGISESAYAGVDFHKTYQYRAFGVPGLGFKRGLSDDLVIAPYATFLALQVDPAEALRNIYYLEEEGLRGEYGFYEAVDYTAARLTVEEKSHVVKSFLAHHQGMSLVAIDNVLHQGIMQERFHRIPEVKSSELLLQERFPITAPTLVPHRAERRYPLEELKASRTFVETNPYTPVPRTMLLSNGHYSLLVDNAGGGYSFFDRDIMLTRWREEGISNSWGQFIFLHDKESGTTWSTGFQPMRGDPESYRITFDPAQVELWRREEGIVTHTNIAVCPDQNYEVRRVQLTNTTARQRAIEVTSFAEVALAHMNADIAHPAFSKMFVETEYIPEIETIICARRPRSRKEEPIYLFHTITMPVCFSETEHETSRAAFLGRGRTIGLAESLRSPLARNTGPVLDPIVSLRTRLDLEPTQTLEVAYVTGFSRSKQEILRLAQQIRQPGAVERVFELASSYADVELRHQQFSVSQMLAFQRLANALWFLVPEWRAREHTLQRNTLGQSGLWRFGISGDLPIVLLRVSDPEQVSVAQELVLAHEFLRLRGVAFDLVILDEYPGGYLRNFHEELEFILRAGGNSAFVEQRGGLFLRSISQLSDEEVILLESVARVLLHGSHGSLSDQLQFKDVEPPRRRRKPIRLERAKPAARMIEHSGKRDFENDFGGFIDGGHIYEMTISGDKLPPLPWSNVIANKYFGCLVTESGGGYTWSQNSREYKLTPWSNDPVVDARGEVLYIRDAASGHVWCPTPLPVRNEDSYLVSHGFGWSSFLTNAQEIESELTISCSPTRNVKWWHLRLKNSGNSQRKLELYLYVEWVLGVAREQSYRYLVPGMDERSNTLYVRNPWANEFAGRIAAIGCNLDLAGYATSRHEFIGRHHGLAAPEAINNKSGTVKLSNKCAVGLDSCGVLSVNVTLKPSEEREILFFMAEEATLDELRVTATSARSFSEYHKQHEQAVDFWKKYTQTVQVKTPDQSFNTLMNGWLTYQTLSCRIFARSAFYQSGGAYGFRDQLQDSLALLSVDPDLTRNQILLHASRQFIEGDVQHWWHPPSGRGTRTKFSDDYLWLPYATARYLEATGDWSLLDAEAPFVEAPLLEEHQHETYMHPKESMQRASIYEHCLRAIARSFPVGAHGLPLMGVGDWNDGMNEIGIGGKGESVWVAWFLIDVLRRFIPVCQKRGDSENAQKYSMKIEALTAAAELSAWDGNWYKRAFFDDGTPLGSSANQDCKIDSLSQSWSVIAGTAQKERQLQAMAAADKQLVDANARIIKLLTPSFDKGAEQPGYIKGYLPGLRENGGQYTHAAAWFIMATAMLGQSDRAFELFKLINPIDICAQDAGLKRYRGEPYVVAGDVYSNPAQLGHVGWSWYTGSSGWLYQVGLHTLLGLQLRENSFTLDPHIPSSWREYWVKFTRGRATFNIRVLNPNGVTQGLKSITVNGAAAPANVVALDGYYGEVAVEALLG
ncbi:MAG: hypothetical protein K1X79_03695 [Oligoflexia bacterium]|nr:hypothetical protein [Oligoflexia bacterium]